MCIPSALETLIDRLPAAVAVLDTQRHIQFVNRRFASMFFTDARALRGAKWECLIHAADQALDRQLFEEMCAQQRAEYHVEQRVQHLNGAESWARLAFAMAPPSASEAAYIVVTVEDISELMRLRFDVVERRKELAALHALSRQLLEVPSARPLQWLQRVVELIPPAFRWPAFTEAAVQTARHEAHTAGHSSANSPVTPRIRIEWADDRGTVCFLEALYTGPAIEDNPFFEEERMLIACIADLLRVAVTAVEQSTDCANIQRELASSEMHLEMALASVRMGIVDWDAATDLCRLSGAARELFGLSGNQRVFSTTEIRARIHPEDWDSTRAYFANASQSNVLPAHEYRMLQDDGSIRWISKRGRLFFDETGKPTRRLSVIVDITERKSLEAQYRQAQKMEALGLLAGGIAHDFNNLLTIIGATGELARSELPAEHVATRDVIEILDAVRRGHALTRQLLTFSRRDVVRKTRIDLSRVLQNTESMLRHMTGTIAELRVSTDSRALVVLADPNQLEQVVLNLVVNARDALPDGGRIDVRTSLCALDEAAVALRPGIAPGAYALLTVSDNGVGMSEATQARIFEPFFTTKDASRGTGLGLSTVFGIVKQAGGHIAVYSENGRGATFRVYLPIARGDEAEAESVAVPQPSVPRGHESILLVDDEPKLREVTARILKELGYSVFEAADGTAALAMAREPGRPIDLLLCDMALPGLDGPDVAAAVQITRPGMPTVFMSGYAADEVGERLYLDANAPFLEKPYTRAALADIIRRTLDAAPRNPAT